MCRLYLERLDGSMLFVRLKDGARLLVRGGADNVSDVLKLDVDRPRLTFSSG